MAKVRVDEVLGKAMPSDSSVVPRFTIKDSSGNVVVQNSTIELDNPVVTAGMSVDKQAMDECLAASGVLTGTNGTLVLAQTGYALADGAFVRFRSNRNYTGACTLNINGTGAKTVLDSWGNTSISVATGIWYIAQYSSNLSAYIVHTFDPFPVGHIAMERAIPNANYAAPEEGFSGLLYDPSKYPGLLKVASKVAATSSITTVTAVSTAGALTTRSVLGGFVCRANGYDFYSSVYDSTGAAQNNYFAYCVAGQKAPVNCDSFASNVVNLTTAPSSQSGSYWCLRDVTYVGGRYYFLISRASSATANTRYLEIFSTQSLTANPSSWVRLRAQTLTRSSDSYSFINYFAYSGQNNVVLCYGDTNSTSSTTSNTTTWLRFSTASGATTDGWNGSNYLGRANVTSVSPSHQRHGGQLLCRSTTSNIFYTFATEYNSSGNILKKLTVDLSSTTTTTATVSNLFSTATSGCGLVAAWMSSSTMYVLVIYNKQLRFYHFTYSSSANFDSYDLIVSGVTPVSTYNIDSAFVQNTYPTDLVVRTPDLTLIKFTSNIVYSTERLCANPYSSFSADLLKLLSENTMAVGNGVVYVFRAVEKIMTNSTTGYYLPEGYNVYIKYH